MPRKPYVGPALFYRNTRWQGKAAPGIAGATCGGYADFIMRDAMPRWRTIAAVRVLSVALGAAITLIYVALIWTSPPPIDWPHARLRSVLGLYILIPALLFGGPSLDVLPGRGAHRAAGLQ